MRYIRKMMGIMIMLVMTATVGHAMGTNSSVVDDINAITHGMPWEQITANAGEHTQWHVHPNSDEIIIAEGGVGYVQLEGEAPIKLEPGMAITIPAGVKHWEGAAKHSEFQSVSALHDGPMKETKWIQAVNQKSYNRLAI